MYAMTAAHPTLPIPSYVRPRTPAAGVAWWRVNDRGPFLHGRVIDLSGQPPPSWVMPRAAVARWKSNWSLIRPGSLKRSLPVRAGTAAVPPMALMAIADTPQRIALAAGGLVGCAGIGIGFGFGFGSIGHVRGGYGRASNTRASRASRARAGSAGRNRRCRGAGATRAVEVTPPERLDVE